jgi:hypothetical protein
MSENTKKIAVGGSALALARAMGLQTFVFKQSDIQTLKEEVQRVSERMAKLEKTVAHE